MGVFFWSGSCPHGLQAQHRMHLRTSFCICMAVPMLSASQARFVLAPFLLLTQSMLPFVFHNFADLLNTPLGSVWKTHFQLTSICSTSFPLLKSQWLANPLAAVWQLHYWALLTNCLCPCQCALLSCCRGQTSATVVCTMWMSPVTQDVTTCLHKWSSGFLNGHVADFQIISPASPMYAEGSFDQFPLICVLWGEDELLAEQITCFCDVWSRKGADITLLCVEGGVHVPTFFSFCHDGSKQSLLDLADFFKRNHWLSQLLANWWFNLRMVVWNGQFWWQFGF